MSDWVDVIAETALAEGENIVVDVDGTDIALFKIQGSFYAIEDICSHDGAEIASGLLDGDEIICPWSSVTVIKLILAMPIVCSLLLNSIETS